MPTRRARRAKPPRTRGTGRGLRSRPAPPLRQNFQCRLPCTACSD
ncbi:hypothetical protein BURPS406E_G0476 [Burkholderia pseudomallei 406e]|nr:hypothetical protein BURPS406E_G0476 [Burkholderia pseudomallei 406e]